MALLHKALVVLLSLSCPVLPAVADIPEVVQGSEAYDRNACLANYTNDCINAACPTSSSTDCNKQCASTADYKCKIIETKGKSSLGFDMNACILRYTNDCITNICPTSTSRDCNGDCRSNATNKCADLQGND